MKICYHGTNEENAKSILKEGFRDRTWFAANLQDALAFGGEHVFQVVFDKPPNNWQFMSVPVPSERIVKYTVYQQQVVMENEALRKKIFDYNT